MSGRQIIPFCGAYEQKGSAAILSASADRQFKLLSAILQNRSGAAATVGLLKRRSSSLVFTSTLIAANTPDLTTDVSAALLAGTATTLVTTTNNDGFLVESSKPFGLIGLSVSQASTGSPVYTYQYFNGTSYVDLPDVIEAAGYAGVADKLLVFSRPRDWVPGSTVAIGGSDDLYSIKIVATTAPSQAVKATSIWLGEFIHLQTGVADKGNLSVVFPEERPHLFNQGEGLLPYFSTAAAGNLVTALYETVG